MGQLRKRVRALSAQVREGDPDAASALLSHSVRLGHGRLAARRGLLACAMGARVSQEDARYCADILGTLPREAVRTMAAEEKQKALRYLQKRIPDV